MGALVAYLQPFAPCGTIQLIMNSDVDGVMKTLKVKSRRTVCFLLHASHLKVSNAEVWLSNRDKLICQHRFKDIMLQHFVAQPAEMLVVATRPHGDEILFTLAEAQSAVMSAPGSKNKFAWRPPAARRESMSDFHAVHVDPIFSPVLVIIASQHQHDFLALCILRQFKSVTKPAVTIVFDFIGRLVSATQATQQQIVRRPPFTV